MIGFKRILLAMIYTVEQKLACIEREINMRKHVYPNRILTKRMSKQKAEYELALMSAIADDYRKLVSQPKQDEQLELLPQVA